MSDVSRQDVIGDKMVIKRGHNAKHLRAPFGHGHLHYVGDQFGMLGACPLLPDKLDAPAIILSLEKHPLSRR
jgi:hypothetical protein